MNSRLHIILNIVLLTVQVFASADNPCTSKQYARCPPCISNNTNDCWEGCVLRSSWVKTTFHATSFAIFAPIVGLIAMVVFLRQVLDAPEGDGQQVEVAKNIREGAIGYMKSQYSIISGFTVFVAVVILLVLRTPKDVFAGHLGKNKNQPYYVMMVHFIIGSVLSAASGIGGMHVAFRANVRTTEACNAKDDPLNKGLRIAFKSGCVMGLSVVSYVVFGQAILFLIFKDPLALSGFGFGASLVALFSRVGGGIFTKAADVGADLVGKVESGLPEDDPRNPGTIADNVGDNVGDVAGLGADLFESYVGATVAAVPLGFHMHGLSGIALPFWISGAGIICSIFGTFFVSTKEDAGQKELLHALRRGIFVSAFLISCASAIICWQLFNQDTDSGWKLFACCMIGLFAGIVVGNFTEYTTSDAYYPTRSIATRGAKTGPATVIIRGFGLGMISTIVPGLVLACAALICAELQGPYGVSIAAIGMLSTLGITLATDAYGPVADNAGGIAEMSSDLPDVVRQRTDLLDALGNTTAATGKGFAIGSALLITLALIATFTEETGTPIDMTDKFALSGGIVGSLLPFLFAALTMYAVGSSAEELIVEVRRQFRENPDLLKNPDEIQGPLPKADYKTCVEIATHAALKEMILPGVISVMAPIAFGFTFGAKFLGGILVGSIFSGFFLGISMANAGGAWDNAKKYVERGEVVEKGMIQKKGTDWHSAVVVGDTVGDPFKDTSGPALNILSKLMSHLSLIISGAIGQNFEKWEIGIGIWCLIAVAGCLSYAVISYRAPVDVRLTLEDTDWQTHGYDDPKKRLELQTNIVKVLTDVGNCEKGRFKLGEIYQLYKDTEITFQIVPWRSTSNQKSIYTRLSEGSVDIISRLNLEDSSIGLKQIKISDTERTYQEARAIDPRNKEKEEKKRHHSNTDSIQLHSDHQLLLT